MALLRHTEIACGGLLTEQERSTSDGRLHLCSDRHAPELVIDLESTPAGWTGSYDTTNAAPGIVYWHAWCDGSAQDGYFRIT
jgi:hypothetical protein